MPFQEKNKPMTEMQQEGRDSLSYAKFCEAAEERKEVDKSRIAIRPCDDKDHETVCCAK